MRVNRAVKSIKKNRSSSESFFFEANILKNLKHPCIPTIYDVEEDEEFYYVIEEYIDGISLEQFFQEYPNFSNSFRIDIVRQLCEVVEYLHNNKPYPIIHLDIKPQNIIVSGERIYLIDFGNGYMMHSDYTKHFYFGSDGYAAPEQYKGEEINTMSDMYALAKVIILVLGSIVDDELFNMLDICVRKTKGNRITAGDIRKYLNQTYYIQVSRTIYIFGTQPGVGATHLAISLVSCLNKCGRKAVYINDRDDTPQNILQEKDFSVNDKGIADICGSTCSIMPVYSHRNTAEHMKDVWKIVDAGVAGSRFFENTMNVILVCGEREWEKNNTFNVLMQIEKQEVNRLLRVCNCGNGINVPYIKNPFRPSVYERFVLRKIISVIRKWE